MFCARPVSRSSSSGTAKAVTKAERGWIHRHANTCRWCRTRCVSRALEPGLVRKAAGCVLVCGSLHATPVKEQLWAGRRAWGSTQRQLLCSYLSIDVQISTRTARMCACNSLPLRGEYSGACQYLADTTRAIALEPMECYEHTPCFFFFRIAYFLAKWHLLPVPICLLQSRDAGDESLL